MSYSIRFHLWPLWVLAACGGPGAPKSPNVSAASDSAVTSGSDTETAEPDDRDPHTDTDTAAADDTSDPTDADTLEVLPSGPWCTDPADALSYTDIAPDLGLVSTLDGLSARKEAGPVAALDLDGDGLDELLVGHRRLGLILHRNVDGRFIQQPLLEARDLTGIAIGDIDGDGDLDIWTGGYHPRMWLLRNDGPSTDGWTFTDISTGSGLDTVPNLPQKTDATFGDFDLDGDLDLYINRSGPPRSTDEANLDQLFRSNGDGTFEAVSSWLTAEQRQGVSWSAVWTDLNLDDRPDLFVANADQATAGPSLLLENAGADGTDWRFDDRSSSCFCTNNFNPMGVSSADWDNDGDFDLYLTNTSSDQLLANDGAFTFIDVSRTVGDLTLPSAFHMTFGSVWTDVNNDGWQDIFVSSGPLSDMPDPTLDTQPDRLLLGGGDGELQNRAAELGVDSTGIGRGVTRANLDGDGYPEIVVINLDGPSHIWRTDCLANPSLLVELRQDGPNTRAIGARVTLHATDGTTQLQEITAKPGWGGAMEPRAWFGLGSRTPETLTVRWPDGEEESWSLAPNTDGRVRIER